MSFLEQNAMETFIRRRVDELFATQYLSKSNAAARVVKTSTTSVPVGATSAVTWDTETIDRDNMFDGANTPTRLTIKTAGIYIVGGELYVQALSGTATHIGRAYPRFNGVTAGAGVSVPASNETDNQYPFTDLAVLGVNDYVEAMYANNKPGEASTHLVTGGVFYAIRIG